MTIFVKNRVIESWKNAGDIINIVRNVAISGEATTEELISTLSALQGAIIAVGETIEKTSGSYDCSHIIRELEELCESIFALSQTDGAVEEIVAGLERLADDHSRIAGLIGNMETKKLAVFLPYKYSMWDSLASIYEAVAADPEWDAVVMPIPYRECSEEENNWVYEGGYFEEIPVTGFKAYALEDVHPDAIYIHNPYDATNTVTRVAEEFYSDNLKKCTDCLVYVPYFFTGEKFPDVHCRHRSYNNYDCIVVPSQYAKKQILNINSSWKVEAFGSPKIDTMIKMGNERNMPEEWRQRIRGRKVVLYNTGLNEILNIGFRDILKMRQVFNYFKRHTEMVLWWRPHPLAKTTIKSMCPHLLGAYEEMEKAYILENIGIYDTTQDSNRAIACTDAFMGDVSSMQNLFGIMGKPVFILNDYVTDEPDEDDRLRLFPGFPGVYFDDLEEKWRITDHGMPDGSLVFYDGSTRMLYKYHIENRNVEPFRKIEWDIYTFYVAHIDVPEKAVLKVYPRFSKDPVLTYKMSEDSWSEDYADPVMSINLEEQGGITYYDGKICVLPGRCDDIYTVDIDTGEVKVHKWDSSILRQSAIYPNEALFTSAVMVKGKIFLLSLRANAVLSFDIKSQEIELHTIGKDGIRYANIWHEPMSHSLWLISHDGTSIVKCSTADYSWKSFDIDLPGYIPRRTAFESSLRPAFLRMAWYGDELIAVPALANMFLKIDINTCEVRQWKLDFLYELGQRKGSIFTSPDNFGWSIPIDDKRMMLQSMYDGKMNLIDMTTGDIEAFDMLTTKEIYDSIPVTSRMIKSDNGCYVFYEDPLHFNMSDMMNFFKDATQEELMPKRQREYAVMGIENADGTCGEKIHEFIANRTK